MKLTSVRSTGALVGAVTSLALALTACGGAAKTPEPGTANAAQAKPTALTLWSWIPANKDVVAAFNASHPDIQVKFEQIPAGMAGGYEKMTNAVKAGQVPDIVQVEYNALPELVTQGAIADLTEAAGDLVKTNFPQQIQEQTTLGGKTWAVPFDAAPQVFWYRKDFFDKNKIDVPKTWDEFAAAAAKVKKADKKVRIASFWNNDAAVFQGLAWQAGGKWFGIDGDAWSVAIDDEPSRKVAAYWQDLVDKDLVRNEQGWSEGWTKNLVDGNTIGYLGASWTGGGLRTTAPEQSGKWAAAPMPNWGTPASGQVGGASYTQLKGAKNTEAAMEFMKWATTTPEGVKARLGSGTSSALPAKPELVEAAKASFDTTYFGGQDIYAVTSAQVATIQSGWVWGPVQILANTKFNEAEAKIADGSGSLADALTATKEAAKAEITTRGMKLADQ